MDIKKLAQTGICLAIVLLFYFVLPVPDGLTPHGWQLTGVFIATILAIIFKLLPIGAIAMIAIAYVAISGVTVVSSKSLADGTTILVDATNPKQSIANALSGFSNPLIWLIGASIMISRGIIKTGLGARIAYYVISLLGDKTLKIAYSLVFSEAILAPVTPSNTARGGGIIHPIAKSICKSFDPEEKDHSKISTYLALVNYQTNPITSAMFITATAPNPLVVNFIADAAGKDFHITWGQWALAMFVPAVLCLVLMPLVVYFVQRPSITHTPNAKQFAKEKLSELGAMKASEYIMIGIFALLLILWAGVFDLLFGIKINATTTAFVGLALALLSKVITWDDVLNERSAWDTVTWFSALVMMATYLNKLGVAKYFASLIEGAMIDMGLGWQVAMVLLALVFLYTHYFFASTTAHISAMFLAFYSVGISLGAPPLLFGFLMAASANLMMSLTHYATGTAPVIFGSGYATLWQWWRTGFIVSVVNFIVFLFVGGLWWKALGYW